MKFYSRYQCAAYLTLLVSVFGPRGCVLCRWQLWTMGLWRLYRMPCDVESTSHAVYSVLRSLCFFVFVVFSGDTPLAFTSS